MAALWARHSLTSSFSEMAQHHGGPGKIAAALSEANLPVIGLTSTAAAARLASALLVRALRLQFMVPLLVVTACLPLFPLYLAETKMRAVAEQRGGTSIFEAQLYIDKMLAAVLLASGVALLAAIYGLLRRPKPSKTSPRLSWWVAASLVLLTVAAVFYSLSAAVRSNATSLLQ